MIHLRVEITRGDGGNKGTMWTRQKKERKKSSAPWAKYLRRLLTRAEALHLAVLVEVNDAQLRAIAQVPRNEHLAPVQVINPIGSVGLPSVRKAVPGKKAAPKHPVVQEDESNWTKTELNAVRKMLTSEAEELAIEIAQAEESFHALIMESGEGAGRG